MDKTQVAGKDVKLKRKEFAKTRRCRKTVIGPTPTLDVVSGLYSTSPISDGKSTSGVAMSSLPGTTLYTEAQFMSGNLSFSNSISLFCWSLISQIPPSGTVIPKRFCPFSEST